MSQMLEPDLSVVDLRSYFVRKRNALLVRGRFSPLYLDYYLHLMQHALQNVPHLLDCDRMLCHGHAGRSGPLRERDAQLRLPSGSAAPRQHRSRNWPHRARPDG